MGARIGVAVLARFAAKPTLVAPNNPAAGRLNPFAEGLYTDWVTNGRAPEDLIAGLRSARTGAAFGEVRDYVTKQANTVFSDTPKHVGEAVLTLMDSGALFVANRAAFGTVRVLEDMLAAVTTRAEAAEAALAAFVAGTRTFVGDAAEMAALVASLGPWLRAVQNGTYVPNELPSQAGQAAEGLDAAGQVIASALAGLVAQLSALPVVTEETVAATAPVAGAEGGVAAADDAAPVVEGGASLTETTSAQAVPQDWIDAAIAKFGAAEDYPKFQRIPAAIRKLLVAQSAKKVAASKQVYFKRARQKLSVFERETLQSLTDHVAGKFPELTGEETEVVWAILYGRIEVYLRGEMTRHGNPDQQLAPAVKNMHYQFSRWVNLTEAALKHFRASQVGAAAVPRVVEVVPNDAPESEFAEPAVTAPTAAAMTGGGEGGQQSGQSASEPAAHSDAIVAEITRQDRAEMTQRVVKILRKVKNLRDQISGDDDDATVLRGELNTIGEGAQSQRALITTAVDEMWTGIVDAVTEAEGDLTAAEKLVSMRGQSPAGAVESNRRAGDKHRRHRRDRERTFEARRKKQKVDVWPEIPGVNFANAELEKKLPESWREKMIGILRDAPTGLQDPQGEWWQRNGVHTLQRVNGFYSIRVTETSPGYRLLVYRSTDGTVHVRFAGSHAGYDKVCGLKHTNALRTWGKARDSR